MDDGNLISGSSAFSKSSLYIWKFLVHVLLEPSLKDFNITLLAQMVKNPPAMWETWVWSLGLEDPLEKGLAIHSSILAWRIPWTKEPGRLQAMGLQRVGHNWVTFAHSLAGMWNEYNCALVWTFFGIALLWDWDENWLFPVLWPLLSFPNLQSFGFSSSHVWM